MKLVIILCAIVINISTAYAGNGTVIINARSAERFYTKTKNSIEKNINTKINDSSVFKGQGSVSINSTIKNNSK